MFKLWHAMVLVVGVITFVKFQSIRSFIRKSVFRNKINGLKVEIFEKVRKKNRKGKNVSWFYKETDKFLEEVKSKIPNHKEYLAFFFLQGETAELKKIFKYDFPKPYSAVDFLKRTIIELV